MNKVEIDEKIWVEQRAPLLVSQHKGLLIDLLWLLFEDI
jgi:hypothetical protein